MRVDERLVWIDTDEDLIPDPPDLKANWEEQRREIGQRLCGERIDRGRSLLRHDARSSGPDSGLEVVHLRAQSIYFVLHPRDRRGDPCSASHILHDTVRNDDVTARSGYDDVP